MLSGDPYCKLYWRPVMLTYLAGYKLIECFAQCFWAPDTWNRFCFETCTCVRVVIKNDQVLNGKTSLWKVSSSKRDPKKEHLQDLIARFWDVDVISGNRCDYTSMYVFDTNREMIWSILACFLLAVKRIKPFFTADHTQYALRATLLRKSYLVTLTLLTYLAMSVEFLSRDNQGRGGWRT